MDDYKRPKKADKAKDTKKWNGGFSAKHVRLTEKAQQKKRDPQSR